MKMEQALSRPGKLILLLGAFACLHQARGEEELFASYAYAMSAAPYLYLPADAQALALGNAVVAWSQDCAGAAINPALYDRATGPLLMASQALWNEDREFWSIAFAMPVGDKTVYAGRVRGFGIANIERRDKYGFKDGEFDDNEYAVDLAAAGRFGPGISVGALVRYLTQSMEEGQAHGFGVDGGLAARPFPWLQLGLSATNLASALMWNTGHTDNVLPEVRLGVGGIFLDERLIAELDLSKTQHLPEEVALGVEYAVHDLIRCRAGVTSSMNFGDFTYRDPIVSLGVGIRKEFFGVDYACKLASPDSDMSQRLTLLLFFDRL
jgi:hypothetical protein